ncbi:MAG TPA: CoA transferase [Burkholderiaceae bacterium]
MTDGSTRKPTAALEGVTVLEVPGTLSAYTGKLLADLGARVILVEPRAGTRGRWAPPLIRGADDRDGDASLAFGYYNTSKQSITLDLDHPRGQQVFRRLAATASLVLESERPGTMRRRGLDHAALAASAPALVSVSVTPFGASGPYADYEGEDIVLLALGGLLSLAGFIDSAPTRVWGNQAVLAAAQFAAVGALAALLHAEAHGEGQLVDVAAQQCVVMALENAAQFADLEGTVRKRAGGAVRYAGTGIFPCTDGEVFVMAAGVGEPRFWQNTVAWLRSEGVAAVEEIADDKWRDFRFLATDPAKAVFNRIFAPFAATRSLKYLYHEGQRRGVPIAPMSSPSDLVRNDQLNARGHFTPFEHPSAPPGALMPGAPYAMSQTPAHSGRAPRRGEHTDAVLAAAGFDAGEIKALRAEEVL